jgi:hypothetical protein
MHLRIHAFDFARHLLVLALLMAVASGCASTARMYSGNPLPANEIAIIENRANIRVLSVDRSRLLENTTFRKYKRPKRIELLPGEHEVVFAYKLPPLAFRALKFRSVHVECVQERRVEFVAEAGHKYITVEEIQTSPFFEWKPFIFDISRQEN